MKKFIFSMLAVMATVALFGNEPEDKNTKKDQETPVVTPDQKETTTPSTKELSTPEKSSEVVENKEVK